MRPSCTPFFIQIYSQYSMQLVTNNKNIFIVASASSLLRITSIVVLVWFSPRGGYEPPDHQRVGQLRPIENVKTLIFIPFWAAREASRCRLWSRRCRFATFWVCCSLIISAKVSSSVTLVYCSSSFFSGKKFYLLKFRNNGRHKN